MSMRLFSLFLALALTVSLARAQESAAAAETKPDDGPKPARSFGHPASTPAPASTPVKKRGFFERLFGSKGHTPAARPTPAAAATPTPVMRRKPIRRSTPVPEATEKPKADDGADKPAAVKTPPPPEPTATPVPRGKGKGKAAGKEPSTAGDPDPAEKAKYDEVKTRASADPKVAELQTKAESAPSEVDGRKALRTYNKALFEKMRELDPTLAPRIDRMQSAVMKRLED